MKRSTRLALLVACVTAAIAACGPVAPAPDPVAPGMAWPAALGDDGLVVVHVGASSYPRANAVLVRRSGTRVLDESSAEDRRLLGIASGTVDAATGTALLTRLDRPDLPSGLHRCESLEPDAPCVPVPDTVAPAPPTYRFAPDGEHFSVGMLGDDGWYRVRILTTKELRVDAELDSVVDGNVAWRPDGGAVAAVVAPPGDPEGPDLVTLEVTPSALPTVVVDGERHRRADSVHAWSSADRLIVTWVDVTGNDEDWLVERRSLPSDGSSAPRTLAGGLQFSTYSTMTVALGDGSVLLSGRVPPYDELRGEVLHHVTDAAASVTRPLSAPEPLGGDGEATFSTTAPVGVVPASALPD